MLSNVNGCYMSDNCKGQQLEVGAVEFWRFARELDPRSSGLYHSRRLTLFVPLSSFLSLRPPLLSLHRPLISHLSPLPFSHITCPALPLPTESPAHLLRGASAAPGALEAWGGRMPKYFLASDMRLACWLSRDGYGELRIGSEVIGARDLDCLCSGFQALKNERNQEIGHKMRKNRNC